MVRVRSSRSVPAETRGLGPLDRPRPRALIRTVKPRDRRQGTFSTGSQARIEAPGIPVRAKGRVGSVAENLLPHRVKTHDGGPAVGVDSKPDRNHDLIGEE